jgi:hypothetical protein
LLDKGSALIDEPLAELRGKWVDRERMMCVLVSMGSEEVFIGTCPGSVYKSVCCGAGRHAAAQPAHKGIWAISANDLLMKVI